MEIILKEIDNDRFWVTLEKVELFDSIDTKISFYQVLVIELQLDGNALIWDYNHFADEKTAAKCYDKRVEEYIRKKYD